MPAIVPSSWGSGRARRLREFNDCHTPAGSDKGGEFCDGDGVPSRGAKGTSDFDATKRATWLKVGTGWHRGPNDEEPYGFMPDDPNYEVPATTHKLFRAKWSGAWGGSHSGSRSITGSSAALMGIDGYDTEDDEYQELAAEMLASIHGSPGAEETLYHSFQNRAHDNFAVGDTLKLPLTATAGEPKTTYGIRSEQEDQEGPPAVFVFPAGTKMLAYGKWPTNPKSRDYEDGNAKEFGHVYSEAIVAGAFRVTKVEVKYFGSMHSRHGVPEGKTPQIFNPTSGQWEKARG
jgi:hypothetical protein